MLCLLEPKFENYILLLLSRWFAASLLIDVFKQTNEEQHIHLTATHLLLIDTAEQEHFYDYFGTNDYRIERENGRNESGWNPLGGCGRRSFGLRHNFAHVGNECGKRRRNAGVSEKSDRSVESMHGAQRPEYGE